MPEALWHPKLQVKNENNLCSLFCQISTRLYWLGYKFIYGQRWYQHTRWFLEWLYTASPQGRVRTLCWNQTLLMRQRKERPGWPSLVLCSASTAPPHLWAGTRGGRIDPNMLALVSIHTSMWPVFHYGNETIPSNMRSLGVDLLKACTHLNNRGALETPQLHSSSPTYTKGRLNNEGRDHRWASVCSGSAVMWSCLKNISLWTHWPVFIYISLRSHPHWVHKTEPPFYQWPPHPTPWQINSSCGRCRGRTEAFHVFFGWRSYIWRRVEQEDKQYHDHLCKHSSVRSIRHRSFVSGAQRALPCSQSLQKWFNFKVKMKSSRVPPSPRATLTQFHNRTDEAAQGLKNCR